MRSLHEAFETVLQFLEVAAAEPARLAGPLALAAVRTLGRCNLWDLQASNAQCMTLRGGGRRMVSQCAWPGWCTPVVKRAALRWTTTGHRQDRPPSGPHLAQQYSRKCLTCMRIWCIRSVKSVARPSAQVSGGGARGSRRPRPRAAAGAAVRWSSRFRTRSSGTRVRPASSAVPRASALTGVTR